MNTGVHRIHWPSSPLLVLATLCHARMEYYYAPLKNATSIRLLHLGSGYGSSPLDAHVATCELEDRPNYESLSYVWGEPDLTEMLLVDGREFRISKNLSTILHHLRLPDKTRILWIDAICINQQDNIEKGKQIALMGQIYQRADSVLCWLGELSTQRLSALEFLQVLAEEALRYIKPDQIGFYWTFLGDTLLPGVDVNLVIQAGLEAHVEALYDSDWFTRLWIVQELALARNPRIICGIFELSWEQFEVATRVIASCLQKFKPFPIALRHINNAWEIIHVRGKHSLNMGAFSETRVTVRLDQPWTVGSLAWDMRGKKCKDDRDRVYGLLSLTANEKNIFLSETFMPDYSRSAEWAYHQFWMRFGGFTSLFYAGLSRRGGCSKQTNGEDIHNKGGSILYNDNYLPSWVPELRPHHTKECVPIFGPNYSTSAPFHHMNVAHDQGPGILLLRGHRFDVVVRGFHVSGEVEPCQKLQDFVNFRATINFFLSLQSKYEPYPSGQPWVEALGSTLMTDMPSEDSFDDHPFQRYLDQFDLETRLSNNELQRIWKLYMDLLLADTGDVWTKLRTVALSRKVSSFDPSVEFDHDGQLVWMLHKYLSDVLHAHRLIITERGYMGLAPPDTTMGDVVVALGGPGVPFVVRETSLQIDWKVVPDGGKGKSVPDGVWRTLSQLLGPCYLQGIMNAELWGEGKDKMDFEWEKNEWGTVPKPTLCLI